MSTDDLLQRAGKVILGGGQGHKHPTQIPGYPAYVVRGKGCRFWDDQGREFIDYLCAFGPILLGYAHPKVDAAVKQRMDEGIIFNLPHPSEADLAQRLIDLIPCAELVAYFTGGSGATTGAVKIARGYTGREKVIRCGYHGWHDWCRPQDPGCPKAMGELTLDFGFNDIGGLEKLFAENPDQVACVIMEPVIGNGPEPGFLEAVKSACAKNGAVFILDEVKTGFRFALGGAQQYLGVTPDLATFGKAMANGYDIGVVVGKRKIMEESNTYLAATFHAHLLGIAATMATIDEMERIDGISVVWRQGQKLMDGLNEIARRHGVDASCKGYAPMPLLRFGESAKEIGTKFWEGAAKRGIYFSPSHPWFISTVHDDAVIDQTLAASEEAMAAAVA
jgi:glutamate-1-semialdehyde 2,1-aminomutase